jgi:hypothetical protein
VRPPCIMCPENLLDYDIEAACGALAGRRLFCRLGQGCAEALAPALCCAPRAPPRISRRRKGFLAVCPFVEGSPHHPAGCHAIEGASHQLERLLFAVFDRAVRGTRAWSFTRD